LQASGRADELGDDAEVPDEDAAEDSEEEGAAAADSDEEEYDSDEERRSACLQSLNLTLLRVENVYFEEFIPRRSDIQLRSKMFTLRKLFPRDLTFNSGGNT
jgi:hypothetical protein